MPTFAVGGSPEKSGLQFGIPVEIVHPAFVQVVRRERPSVVVQVLNRRLVGMLVREHAGLFWQLAALFEVAGRAGRDNIVPCRLSAMGAGDDVIEGQVVARSAILALELVAKEHVEAGKGGVSRWLNIGLEADDTRQSHRKTGRAHRVVVFRDDVHTVEEDCLDRVLPGPERQGIITQWPIVCVQDERRQGLW